MTSRALRLESGGACIAAVAPHEVVEVLANAPIIVVPRAPAHCCELIEWRSALLPVFDLGRWRAPETAQSNLLAVVAYQVAPGEAVTYGCLRLVSFPKIIEVDDSQVCAMPDEAWKLIAISCFRDDGVAIPILSLAKLFAAESRISC